MQCIFTLVAFELYGLSKTPANASSYPLGRSLQERPVGGFSSSKRVLLGFLLKEILVCIGQIGQSPLLPSQTPSTDRSLEHLVEFSSLLLSLLLASEYLAR